MRLMLTAAAMAALAVNVRAADIGSPVPLEARVTSLEKRVTALEAKTTDCPHCGPKASAAGPAAEPVAVPSFDPPAPVVIDAPAAPAVPQAIPAGWGLVTSGPRVGQLVPLASTPARGAVFRNRTATGRLFGNQTCVGGNCGG